MRPQTKGSVAVERARNSSDTLVLAATFASLVLASSIYFIVDVLTSGDLAGASAVEVLFGIVGALLGGVIVFGALLGIGMFLIRMMRQSILGNSLQVEYSNFAWLRDWANVIAADLDLPHVEIFITQNPVMNAYAFGFAKPYCIVLHSGSIRYLSEDELKVIVLHEMAHIKYAHTLALVYLQPFLTLPVVGIFTGWIAGFWQRRTELTADRLALMYIEDAELVKRSLIKIYVGPDVADAMNQTARDWLQYTAERPMNRFAQTFSSHPFLVRRLSHIDRYAGQLQSVTPPTAVLSVDQ